MRRPRRVPDGAGSPVGEPGQGHAVGVDVEVGEQLREERLDHRGGLLLPPHPVRLGEGDQLPARLDRGARDLGGGDRAPGAAAQDDHEGEGLVAAVVVRHVQHVRPPAEALRPHEPQRGARDLAGRALGREGRPPPPGLDGPAPRRQLPPGPHRPREAGEVGGRRGRRAQEARGERPGPRRRARLQALQGLARRRRQPVPPGYGQDEGLDVGAPAVELGVELFGGEVEAVRRLEGGERAARGPRVAQPRGERFPP